MFICHLILSFYLSVFLSTSCRVVVPLFLVSASWWVKLAHQLVQASWWEGLVLALWLVELGLNPLVGRAVSRGSVLQWLWVQYDFRSSVDWRVGLSSYLAGWLAWGLLGEAPIGKMGISQRSPTAQYSLGLLLPLCTHRELVNLYLPRRSSKTRRYIYPRLKQYTLDPSSWTLVWVENFVTSKYNTYN